VTNVRRLTNVQFDRAAQRFRSWPVHMRICSVEGTPVTIAVFREFLKRVVIGMECKIFLIVD
jgi:hypothetical protein